MIENDKTPFIKRIAVLLFAYSYATFGYLLINHINSNRTHFFDLGFSFEDKIPFVNYFIFMYIILFFAMLALAFVCKKKSEWLPLVKAMILLSTIHFIVFILFPVRVNFRPDITGHTLSDFVCRLIFGIDYPANCFPSLHVAYPLTVALVVKRLRSVYLIISIMLGISVIMVKQHFIADILGAFVTSYFVMFITNKYFRNEQ